MSQPQRFAEPLPTTVRLRIDETSPSPAARNGDLDRKFRELLDSPLGEGVARIVEETYRILSARDHRRPPLIGSIWKIPNLV